MGSIVKFPNVTLAAAAALLALGATAPANASVITGTGLPTTDANLSGGTVVTFDNVASGTSANRTIGNVNIVGATVVEGTFAGSYNTFGTQYLHNDSGSTSSIIFSFLSPVSAFGFNLGAADANWTLSSGGQTYSFAPTNARNDKNFYGITGADLTSALLTFDRGDYVLIDNITTVSNVNGAVPEPATWAMMLLGMGAVGFAMRRRKRNVITTVAYAA